MNRACIWLAMLATVWIGPRYLRAQYPGMPVTNYPMQAAYGPGAVALPPGATLAYQGMPLATPDGEALMAPVVYKSGGGEIACDTPCDGSCGGGCDTCSCGGFEHCWYFYGDFLYLRPRDSEIAWATPANSNIPAPPGIPPVQIGGRLGVVDQDFQPGFRVGLQYATSECTAFSAQYTFYEATTSDFVAITGANVLESLVSHPAIDTAAQNFRQGTANYSLSYDLLDFDYHELLWYGRDYQLGYLAGIGVVQMEQNFIATLTGTGSETVRTDVDFYGASARFGLEGEAGGGGAFRFYGKGIGNLAAGEFRADYDLGHSFDAVVVDTSWRAGRIVGIWELETGVKWVSRCKNYSANLGYMFSAWTNTVQTDQWIRGIQTNSFVDMEDTMTFDGLVARFEARY